MIPVLFTTYNRLDYTKLALRALNASRGIQIYIYDNHSTDGTREWIQDIPHSKQWKSFFATENTGVAGAMNWFLSVTKHSELVGKVDNDTVVPPYWAETLQGKIYSSHLDIVQARHPIWDAVYEGGNFDEWMKTMDQDKHDPSIYYHKFVGGSGILFRREVVDKIPHTDWKLYGWNTFQKRHPTLRKAFCTDVTIELLDMHAGGGTNYSKYPDYYRETKRLQ